MRLVKRCVAIATVGGLFMVPSTASAISLTAPTGTLYPAGSSIILTNVAHASTPSTTKYLSSFGGLECETAEMTGKVIRNELHGTAVELELNTVAFTGKPGTSPHSTACTGGLWGDITWTPNHSSDAIGSLPWCLKFSAEDTFTTRGGKCSDPSKALKFRLDAPGFAACTYEKGSIFGTHTTHPADSVLTYVNQKINKSEGSASCPLSFDLSVALTLTADKAGGAAGGPAYIDNVAAVTNGPQLTAPTGVIATGNIVATNVGHSGAPLTTKLVTKYGNVECETATLTGQLAKNNESVVEAVVTTVEFSGKPNVSPHSVRCSSGFGGDVLVAPSHSVDEGKSLPWCVRGAGADNEFTVQGGICGGPAEALKFSLDSTTLGTCAYERSAVAGPMIGTYTTHPADGVLTISGQQFKKSAGSVFCPGEGELFMAVRLTEDKVGDVEGATAYVDKVAS